MPREWPAKPLAQLAEFHSGGTPSKAVPEYWGGPIPWVTVKDMKTMRFRGSAKTLTEQGANQVRVTPKGSVLVLVRGMSLFNALPVVLCNEPVSFNQDIKSLVPHRGVDSEYLAFALVSQEDSILRHVDSAGHGTGRLATELLKSTSIPLPTLAEQRKIAEVLRTWDRAIARLRAIALLLDRRRTILRDTLIAWAERSAESVHLRDILTESRLAGSDGSIARKITVKLYGKGAVEKSDKRTGSRNTQYYVRRKGHLVYSQLDFVNGAFAILPSSLDGYETTLDLPAFDIVSDVNKSWLIEYLTSPGYYTNQSRIARGQRKARRVVPEDFLSASIKLPVRERQDQVATVLAKAELEHALCMREMGAVLRQRRGLMQGLFASKLHVEPGTADD